MIHALKHCTLQVVIQQHAGHATEGSEGQHMAPQEAVHAGVQAEAQEDAPGIAQHHHEGHQRALGAADLQMAEVTPVHLRLLAGQRAQAQVGLGRWAWTVASHEVAEVVGPAGVASAAHHGVQAAGGERGELGQRVADEGQVGVDLAGPQRRIGAHHAGLGEHALHRVAVQVQLAGDGADAPAFGLVQAQDLRAQFRGYGHGWAPPVRWHGAWAVETGCGAGNPAGCVPRTACGTSGSAMPTRSRARSRRQRTRGRW